MTRTSAPAAVVPPSVIILGSDALLAALPATPTQLANACYASGFEGVFPASWGDELVAAGCLKDLETRMGPAILCSCPLVSEQLRGVAPLQRFQLHLVPPPVAAARYLRALCDDAPLRITYVGDCPGAEDVSIDERVSPTEFLRRLSERGITPLTQRPDLGANVPRDRRRFYSLPGGAPTPEWLSADWPKRTLVEAEAGAALADLAHHALVRESTLIDFAPQLGCACSGAVGGIAPQEARRAVAALEPPRARQEVLDPDLKVLVRAIVPLVRPSREVSWEEFLAALPATMSSSTGQAEGGTAPAAALPEAAAPANAPPAAPPRVTPEATPRTTPQPFTVPGTSSVPPTRATPAPAIGSALTSVRTTQPIPRRAPAPVVEGRSGPRYPQAARHVSLAPADRWLLVALVLGSSVISSALTAFFTVRALGGRSSTPPTVGAVAAPVPHDSVVASRPDSVGAPPIVRPAAAPPLGDQRTLAISAGTSATPAPEKVQRFARPAAAPAPRAATASKPKPAPARSSSTVRTVPAPAPVAAAAATVVQVAPGPPPAPAVAVTRTDSSAQSSAPVPGAAAAAVAASAAPAPAPAAAPAPPAAAAQTTPPVDIAAELKAIRDELNARKRRVDSLTHSLDSLNKAAPPR